MGIWHALKDLTIDRKDFNDWEHSQDDIDAKRNAIHQKKYFSKEELSRAKKLGQTITDVVDVMDQHSEDVAEDVETSSQMLVGLATLLGFVGSGFGFYKWYLKGNIKKYTDALKGLADKTGLETLLEKLNKSGSVTDKIKGEAVILDKDNITGAWFDLHKRTLEKLNFKDIKIKEKITNIAEEASQIHKKIFIKPLTRSVWGTLIIGAATFLGVSIWATKAQIFGSRIGRYQARKKLENEKYFVQYTDEQMEQAKENLKKKPPEKKGLFSFFKKDKQDSDGFWINNWHVISQYGEYKRWKASDKDDAKKVNRVLTPEEIKQAKADKEVIQRVVRKINNKAEEYSENMETAADTILLSSVLGGGALGACVTRILNKTGVINRFIKNKIGKIAGDEGKKLVDDIIAQEKTPRSIICKFFDMLSGKSNQLYKMLNGNFAKLNPDSKILNRIKAIFYTATTSRFARNIGITLIGSMLASIIGSFISLKLQKNASRAGRYAAKQELLNDPKNFIAHDEDDLNQYKNVKAEKPLILKRIGNYLMFIPVSVKQCFEYEKYKKEKMQPARDLKEELIKLDVTKEQLQEAKNLQRKLFNTFEKVDDKSQEYSEAMELTNEVGQQILSQLPNVIFNVIPLLILAKICSGKLSLGNLGKKLLGGVASLSFILKTKLSKKYLNQVTAKLTETVAKTEAPKNLFETGSIINLKNHLPNAENISQYLALLPAELRKTISPEKINTILSRLKNIPDDKIAEFLAKSPRDLLPMLLSNPEFASLAGQFSAIANRKFSFVEIQLMKLSLFATKIIGKGKVPKILSHFVKSDKLAELTAQTDELSKLYTSLGGKTTINELSKILSCLRGKTYADKITRLRKLPETNKLRNLLIWMSERYEKPLNAPLDLPKGMPNMATGFIKNMTANSQLDLISEAAKNPTKLIERLKVWVNEIPPKKLQDFNDRIQTICIKSPIEVGVATKPELLSAIGKLEKILNNLPHKELQKVFDTFKKLLNENPDKLFYLVTKHPEKLYATLNTPVLQNTILGLGISAAAGTVGITYIIASLLAKLQKDAGRYGVMQAMNELNDNAYYANMEPVTKKQNISPQQIVKTGNLLDDFLNQAKSKQASQAKSA